MKLPPLMAEEINKALKMCFEKKKKGMKSFEVVYFVVVKSVLLIVCFHTHLDLCSAGIAI